MYPIIQNQKADPVIQKNEEETIMPMIGLPIEKSRATDASDLEFRQMMLPDLDNIV